MIWGWGGRHGEGEYENGGGGHGEREYGDGGGDTGKGNMGMGNMGMGCNGLAPFVRLGPLKPLKSTLYQRQTQRRQC